MTTHTVLPQEDPSFKRYSEIFFLKPHRSITRELQYELLRKKDLTDKSVLDIGGGKKADYHSFLKCKSYDSINIDPGMEPTWVVQEGERFPCEEGAYDTVIALNTLEHIYDAKFILAECFKALKDGGQLIMSVPFLFPIHGHPDDFFRPTPSWFSRALEECGFSDVTIVAASWGPFSTGYCCSAMPGPLKTFRLHINVIVDVLYAKLRQLHKKGSAMPCLNPQGFFVIAQK